MRALSQPVTVPEATISPATSDGKSTCRILLFKGRTACHRLLHQLLQLLRPVAAVPAPAGWDRCMGESDSSEGCGKYHKELSEKAFDQLE